MLLVLTLTIVLAGDSTTVGTVTRHKAPSVAYAPAARVLQGLIDDLPAGTPWAGAKVVAYGVGGSTSQDWFVWPGDFYCNGGSPHASFEARACRHGLPFVDEMSQELGRRPDLILLTIGTNDPMAGLTPSGSVDILRDAASYVLPSRLLLAPPFHAADGHTDALAAAERDAGILTGPDWPELPRSDAVHLTDGGYAAAAGLWLDAVLAIDPPFPPATPTPTPRPTPARRALIRIR